MSAVGCDNTTPLSGSPGFQPGLRCSYFMPRKQEAAIAIRTTYTCLECTVWTVFLKALPGLKAQGILPLLQLLLWFPLQTLSPWPTLCPEVQTPTGSSEGSSQLLPVEAALVLGQRNRLWCLFSSLMKRTIKKCLLCK